MEEFILRINELMRASNLHSIRELSAVCHIQEGTIARQLRGERTISLETIMSILKNMTNVSSEWLLRGEGPMFRGGAKPEESPADERVPEKEVMLIPAGARGGSFEYFNEQVGLSPYNSEVIRSPFINASFAWSVKDDSMAPDYPAGTVLFVKRLVTSIIKYGNCYVFDTDDGFQFVKLRRSELGDDYVHCVPLNAEDYEPYDVPKSDIHGIYKVLGAMRW